MSSLLNQLFRKKKPSQFLSSKKSMEDLLTSDSNRDSIQKVEQPHSAESIFPERLKTAQAFSINTSSVFNTPIRKNPFQNLYGLLEEHVIDHIGDIINFPENGKPSFNSAETSAEDFKGYIAKLRISHDSYLKDKEYTSQESFEKEETTDIIGSLMRCYRKVPQQYFDPQFHFNFTWLQYDSQDIVKYQKDLEDTLGQVDKNLYYQISTKFSIILKTIQDLTDQENRIIECLRAIKSIRSVNQKLKEGNSGKIFEVMKLKRKQINLQRTLQILDMMNLVKKIAPTLKHLIQRGNYEHAVNLLNSSEQTFSQKLGSVRCLQICNNGFQQARATLQQLLISEFETRSLDYFSQCLSYVKMNPTARKNPQESLGDRIDLTSRRLKKGLFVDSANFQKLEWSLDASAEGSFIAEQVSRVILAHIKLKEVSLSSFRPKLNELFKKVHKQFTTDMNEYIADLNQQVENVQEKTVLTFELKVQFLTFYFRVYRRFLINFSDVITRILSTVINYFDSKFVLESDMKDTHATKILTQTAQEFYSIFNVVVRNFNDKITQMIQLIELNNISADQFFLFEEALEEIITFFKDKFDFQEKLYSSIPTQKDFLRKILTKTISSFLDQMSISPITSLRLISEKQFVQTFYSQKKENLLKKLRQEKWQAIDIPLDKVESLKIILENTDTLKNAIFSPIASASTESSEISSAKMKEIQEDELSISPVEVEQLQSKQKHVPETQSNNIISIKKKTAIINGKKYKISESLLEIAQSIAEFYLLGQTFSSIKEESISKILLLVKLFNSTIDHDILKGNSTSTSKGGVITPEILAFGAASLVLLEQSISILKTKFEKNYGNLSDGAETEAGHIKAELSSLIEKLLMKISEIVRDVVLVDKCAKLKSVRWQDSQEKSSIPTQLSAQIIDKIAGVYKKVSIYLPKENLIMIFSAVLGDIAKYYVPIFEEFDVASGLAAKRIKGELSYFVDHLKRIEIFGDFESDLTDFEKRIGTITDHKCGPFLELASLDEENEVEAG